MGGFFEGILILVVFGFAVVAAGPTQAAFRLIPAQAISTAWIVPVGFKCGLVNGKLVCGDKEGGKKQSNDADNDRPKKSKDKVVPKTCGKKVNCEAGFVRLEKPNKYGACCEAREGLPPTQSADKCKFGMIGTPPNDCHCPAGTDFQGYKGCVKTPTEICCSAKVTEKDGSPAPSPSFGVCRPTEAAARSETIALCNSNSFVIKSMSCGPR